MTLTQLLAQINLAYRGTDDDAPVADTTDYDEWLGTTNRKINEWATDSDNEWSSLFELRDIGTVAAGAQDYDLDDDFDKPADQVIVTTTGGHKVDYRIVKPAERGRYPRTVYISGQDPQILTFSDDILSTDQIVGGTISVAGYFVPADLANPSDVVPVDDPYWLVEAVAGELAFNDITYRDKAADLVAKANNLWKKMVRRNRRGTNANPRVAQTSVQRIRGVR